MNVSVFILELKYNGIKNRKIINILYVVLDFGNGLC